MKKIIFIGLSILTTIGAYTQNNVLDATDKASIIQDKQKGKEPVLDINGYFEGRIGFRVQNDQNQNYTSISEFRLQLETEKELGPFMFNIVSDFVLDPITMEDAKDIYKVDLDTGEGLIDMRQANVVFSPFNFADVKIGRQILTWGTGDLIFINDLFAKDWKSFFIGRNDEYLKAPTDAAKVSIFSKILNIDVVYTPRFGADRFIDGGRISFYDRSLNDFRGEDNPISAEIPDTWFEDDEIAIRVYRSFGTYEGALYYYNGFWKSPAGQEIGTGRAIFPDLEAYGASFRGPIAKGIISLEGGYYKSAPGASNVASIRNDELRLLAGYEREIATELTFGIQYNLVHKLDYEAYVNGLPDWAIKDEEYRHITTLRLTKRLMQQNLKLSLFNYYSPSDEDGYLRLRASYKISDVAKIDGGSNFFYGNRNHTFFNQFNSNSNVYLGLRYEFN